MKIVLEGCDGAGKTSIANILAKKYGCDVVHMTGEDPKDFIFYDQSLRKENVIYDRNVLGERVYPQVFKRPYELSEKQLVNILDRHEDVHFFVITAGHRTMLNRIKDRGNEDQRIIEGIPFIDAMFITLAKQYNIPIIDTTTITVEDAAQQIINIIDEKEKDKND